VRTAHLVVATDGGAGAGRTDRRALR
jgi:hypothetical protein